MDLLGSITLLGFFLDQPKDAKIPEFRIFREFHLIRETMFQIPSLAKSGLSGSGKPTTEELGISWLDKPTKPKTLRWAYSGLGNDNFPNIKEQSFFSNFLQFSL